MRRVRNWGPSREDLEALAREHLPEDVAVKWINLLRPAVHLAAAVKGETVVGQLGGLPRFPVGVEWPCWDDFGPLRFVASVDCARLPVAALDIPLPDAGTLLFFHFRSGEAFGPMINSSDPWTRGARVVHVPPGAPTVMLEVVKPYPIVPLCGRLIATQPGWWHPMMPGVFLAPGEDPDALGDHPILDEDFAMLVDDVSLGVSHQIGGYANPVQGPVEELITGGLLPGVAREDPRRIAEASRWRLLAQLGSDLDADMDWGDSGSLFWMMRPEDLAAQRFDATAFTWECG